MDASIASETGRGASAVMGSSQAERRRSSRARPTRIEPPTRAVRTNSARPTAQEHTQALLAIDALCKLDSSLRPEPRVVACAMALRRSDEAIRRALHNEKFGSDYEAKDAFGISHSTHVRQRWIPLLEQLDAVEAAAQAEAQAEAARIAAAKAALPSEGELLPSVTKTIELTGHGRALQQRARYVQVHWRATMPDSTVVYDSRRAPPEALVLPDGCFFYNSLAYHSLRLEIGWRAMLSEQLRRHSSHCSDDRLPYQPGEPMHMALPCVGAAWQWLSGNFVPTGGTTSFWDGRPLYNYSGVKAFDTALRSMRIGEAATVRVHDFSALAELLRIQHHVDAEWHQWPRVPHLAPWMDLHLELLSAWDAACEPLAEADSQPEPLSSPPPSSPQCRAYSILYEGAGIVTTCQHRPRCKDAEEHEATIRANAAARRERWRVANPDKQPAPRPLFCRHMPPCSDEAEHERKLEATSQAREGRKRAQRPSNMCASHPCGGCNKHVCDDNLLSGRDGADGGWYCARCWHTWERTHCVDCGEACKASHTRCLSCHRASALAEQHTAQEQGADAENPPVVCTGVTKDGKLCKVHSGLSYSQAVPLRNGSLFCHNHRQSCEGCTANGHACHLSSSSEHEHAEPLRRGERFCVHHADQDSKRRCDACWQVVVSEAGLEDADARVPGPVKPWYCDECWDEWEAWPDRCERCGAKHCECAREYCEGCAQRHAYCCCCMPPTA